MPLTVKPPVLKEFDLPKSDEAYGVGPESPTKVTIRQASQGDIELRRAMLGDFERSYSREDGRENGTTKLTQHISYTRLRKLEVRLVLAACNIMASDGSGKPLFVFVNGKIEDVQDFEYKWGALDPLVADEIYSKVIELNPDWDPTR